MEHDLRVKRPDTSLREGDEDVFLCKSLLPRVDKEPGESLLLREVNPSESLIKPSRFWLQAIVSGEKRATSRGCSLCAVCGG